jgi:hypothetical protein
MKRLHVSKTQCNEQATKGIMISKSQLTRKVSMEANKFFEYKELMPRKVLVPKASDYEGLDQTAEYYQARHPYHFALSKLCDYIRDTIRTTNNEDWPDRMLTKAVTILSLCQVGHDHWRAKRFQDALLVGDQAIALVEEMRRDDHSAERLNSTA